MKKILLLFLILFSLGLSAQRTVVVYKIGGGKKYLFHHGDRMMVAVRQRPDSIFSGTLSGMNDSLIYLDMTRLRISDIVKVKTKTYLPGRFREFIIKGGIFYFLISTVNNLINHDQVFTSRDGIVYGALIAGFAATYIFNYRTVKTDENWKIIVADQMIYP